MRICARAWTQRTTPGLRGNTCSQKCKVGSCLLCLGLLAKAFPPYLLPIYHPDTPRITPSLQHLPILGVSSSPLMNLVGLGEAEPLLLTEPSGLAHKCSPSQSAAAQFPDALELPRGQGLPPQCWPQALKLSPRRL